MSECGGDVGTGKNMTRLSQKRKQQRRVAVGSSGPPCSVLSLDKTVATGLSADDRHSGTAVPTPTNTAHDVNIHSKTVFLIN